MTPPAAPRMAKESNDDNCNKRLLQLGNNNNDKATRNNNILLLPPEIQHLLKKENCNNDLLHGFPQLYFEWMSLFKKDSADIHPKIILFLLQHEFCYSGEICKTFPGDVCRQNVNLYFNTLMGHNIIEKVGPGEATEKRDRLKAHQQATRLDHAPRGVDGIQFYTLTEQAKLFFGEYAFWQWKITDQDRKNIQNHEHLLTKSYRQIRQRRDRQEHQRRERAQRDKEQQRQEAAARERKRELLSRAKELAAPYLEAGRERLKEQDYERYRNIYVFMRHVFMYASALQLSPWEILEKHLPPDMVRAIRDMDVEAIVGFYTDREATRRLAQTSQALQHALNSILTAGEDAVI